MAATIKRDIKADLVKKLAFIESGLAEGSEQWYQMRDVIDSLLSSMVKVTYSRPVLTSRPGEAMTADELVLNNVD